MDILITLVIILGLDTLSPPQPSDIVNLQGGGQRGPGGSGGPPQNPTTCSSAHRTRNAVIVSS